MYHISSSEAYVMVREVHGKNFREVPPVEDGTCTASIAEDDKDCDFGDVPLSKDCDVCASHHVGFAQIEAWICKLGIRVPDKSRHVFHCLAEP